MIAIYPGSFDPMTRGHSAVVRRAARLFSHLQVVVAVHPSKSGSLAMEDRIIIIRDSIRGLPNVSVGSTDGFVVDHARAIGATVMVRGIRDEADAVDELGLAKINDRLAPEIITLFLPPERGLEEVRSTEIKRRIRNGADLGEDCSPAAVARLREVLGRESG